MTVPSMMGSIRAEGIVATHGAPRRGRNPVATDGIRGKSRRACRPSGRGTLSPFTMSLRIPGLTAAIIVAALQPVGSQQPGGRSDSTAPAAQPAGPPALTEYKGRRIAQTMHWTGAEWLIRQDREREENAARMLEELKLKPGWTVCDLGCGNGYHALTMAGTVGKDGRILAVDIQPQMLEMLKARAEGRGLRNIETIKGEAWDPKLPDGSCDLILLVDVYHEFSHPEHLLKAMHRALKPDGVVALVEFREEDRTVPIKPEHKMSKAQILKEWLPMGFALEREFDDLPWQHLMFFRRADAPAAKDPAPAAPR